MLKAEMSDEEGIMKEARHFTFKAVYADTILKRGVIIP
jgi:hypothetical protein